MEHSPELGALAKALVAVQKVIKPAVKDSQNLDAYLAVAGRFWQKADTSDPTGCWRWRVCSDREGYGRFQIFRGCSARAPRIAWMLARGPLMPGMVVRHACDTPACVNPFHLELP